ncbi:MAG: hypothetical protein M0Q91_15385 [Methanoregula sp.]|jgi:hypothetical protein|nr:hypothetical protein [Methanoregula sp.]
MGNPYLNRDESIILTTHNVNFNSLVTELILTGQRLIIFDTNHPQFRYQTIPLTSIETVIASEDAQGNPVMYLSVSALTRDSAPLSKEFTFLRQPGGERRQECDTWIKQLKEQIASIRQQKILAMQLADSEKTDIIFDETKPTIIQPVPEDSIPLEEIPPEPPTSPLSTPPVITGVDTESSAGLPDVADSPESDEQVEQAVVAAVEAAEATPKEPLSSRLPSPPASPDKPKTIALAAIIIVILAIAGGAYIYSTMSGENPVGLSVPVITPTITTAVTTIPTLTVQQTPAPEITEVPTPQPTVMVPQKGVWVKVDYAGNYTGRIGASGDLKQVNASGEQYYQLAITEGIVEATIQKQDGSGRVLTIEVYQNGKMVARSTKATPGATVDLRVELKKG